MTDINTLIRTSYKKKALLLNFTAEDLHWGCFGTSIAIYSKLNTAGYYVETKSVYETYNLTPAPNSRTEFFSQKFYRKFCENNKNLITSIATSDIVLVNGEGTLHGYGRGAVNLLYMAYIAKAYNDKAVHIINTSCFPDNFKFKKIEPESIYYQSLKLADLVVAREIYTARLLQLSGIEATLGYDCLPLLLDLDNKKVETGSPEYIVLGGGATYTDKHFHLYMTTVEKVIKEGLDVRLLIGAKSRLCPNDNKLASKLKSNYTGPRFSVIQAKNFEDWANEIANASALITGRFHYTIAAITVGTPSICFRSNTPKVDGIVKMSEGTARAEPLNEDGIRRACQYVADKKNHTQESMIITATTTSKLAENNFLGI